MKFLGLIVLLSQKCLWAGAIDFSIAPKPLSPPGRYRVEISVSPFDEDVVIRRSHSESNLSALRPGVFGDEPDSPGVHTYDIYLQGERVESLKVTVPTDWVFNEEKPLPPPHAGRLFFPAGEYPLDGKGFQSVSLAIHAPKTIFRSFSTNQDPTPPGQSQEAITLMTLQARGELDLQLSGKNGAPGNDGAHGAPGTPGKPGEDGHTPFTVCERPPTNGHRGGDGQPGDPGEAGSSGGNVERLFFYANEPNGLILKARFQPGQGGLGGAGGKGGRGGEGGPAGADAKNCPSARKGPPGFDGKDGSNGANGQDGIARPSCLWVGQEREGLCDFF